MLEEISWCHLTLGQSRTNLEQTTQDPIQFSSEYLQGWSHKLSKQPNVWLLSWEKKYFWDLIRMSFFAACVCGLLSFRHVLWEESASSFPSITH